MILVDLLVGFFHLDGGDWRLDQCAEMVCFNKSVNYITYDWHGGEHVVHTRQKSFGSDFEYRVELVESFSLKISHC